jgi:hypothetical protein
MRKRFWWRGIRVTTIFLTCGVLVGSLVAAQAPDTQTNETPSDTIKCWWKADRSAVQIGEQFMVTVTCGVIETPRVTVVPKMEQFDPAALQLAPFEVLGGTRQNDIQAPPWRYFQYEYTLRLIGQDSFGQDVDIPSLTLTYNIQSDLAGDSSGRDQMHVLPALPIRILSLVPRNANDIRDSTRDSFAEVKTRLFRATTEFISAAILFGFSVLMLAFAAMQVLRKRREGAPARAPVASADALMRACLRETGRLKSEVARGGWTPERTGSALTALRIGSAVAMGRPVAQTPMDPAVSAREGQLALRQGVFTWKRLMVSAPITSDAIERFRTNGNGQAPNRRTQTMVDDLGKSLRTFTAFRYGRNGNVDPAALNRALESGRTALQGLRLARLWPMRIAEMFTQLARTPRSSMWIR